KNFLKYGTLKREINDLGLLARNLLSRKLEGEFMTNFKLQAVVALAGMSLGTWGCATKKHVREAIAPVQQQVNQVQKDTATNKTAIGDLDRTVAGVDEKAQDAGRRAREAAEAADRANSAAQKADSKADAANMLAQQANTNANQVGQNLQTTI